MCAHYECLLVLCNRKKSGSKILYLLFLLLYEKNSREQKKVKGEKNVHNKKPKRNSSELGNQNKIGIDMETEGSIKTIGWKRPV
jgi:hypothetical protein